jgi:hypothetical protein
MLPAYCDPPNPCPLGYTERDGCIEDFENSSEFSRIYQVCTTKSFTQDGESAPRFFAEPPAPKNRIS